MQAIPLNGMACCLSGPCSRPFTDVGCAEAVAGSGRAIMRPGRAPDAFPGVRHILPEADPALTNQTTPPVSDEIEDMAALLDSVSVAEPRQLRRGEVVEGTVMSVERDGVVVDIGFKSEGIVPVQEMHSMGADPLTKLSPGETVLVYVVQPETAEGQVALSIDRARGEQGWRTLQERFESGEIFEAEITGYNKGGLLANVEGVNAFIPMSQVVGAKPGDRKSTRLNSSH